MNAVTRHCSSNFHIELPTFIFRHERFSCLEKIMLSEEFSVMSPGSLLSCTISVKGSTQGEERRLMLDLTFQKFYN